MSLDRCRPAALAALLALAAAAGAGAAGEEAIAGHWEGGIAAVQGSLAVEVELEWTAEGWRGTIDIPQQGAAGLPLAAVRVEGERVVFSIAGVPGEPTFDGTLADGEIRGTFTQTGKRLPFRLSRDAQPGPARPQEPSGALPYGEQEVRYASGELTLAGTLTVPPGEGPFPAVVLLSGSGPQNRDGEVFGHRPLRVLADALARRGIAALRSDDRGVGDSGGSPAGQTTADLAADALAAVAFLRARSEIAPQRVGLVGHSEGGLAAALAAAGSRDVAFVGLLATPGVPGRELLPEQTRRLVAAAGGAPDLAARQGELVAESLRLVESEADPERLRAALREVARRQLELAGGTGAVQGEALEDALARQVELLLTPWFRFFIAFDPQPALARLRVPLLVVAGELDLQVPPDQSVPRIEAALAAGGAADVTIRRLAGLNHLLQEATSGLPAEYYGLEQTLSPQVLALVGDWIAARFASGVPAPGR